MKQMPANRRPPPRPVAVSMFRVPVPSLPSLLSGVHAMFPGANGEVLGVHWAAIPGSVVGVTAGFRAYQMISGDRPRKAAR